MTFHWNMVVLSGIILQENYFSIQQLSKSIADATVRLCISVLWFCLAWAYTGFVDIGMKKLQTFLSVIKTHKQWLILDFQSSIQWIVDLGTEVYKNWDIYDKKNNSKILSTIYQQIQQRKMVYCRICQSVYML